MIAAEFEGWAHTERDPKKAAELAALGRLARMLCESCAGAGGCCQDEGDATHTQGGGGPERVLPAAPMRSREVIRLLLGRERLRSRASTDTTISVVVVARSHPDVAIPNRIAVITTVASNEDPPVMEPLMPNVPIKA